MKNTLITLASVATLAVTANAQTIDTNTPSDWTVTSSAGSATAVAITTPPSVWATVSGASFLGFTANGVAPSEVDLKHSISFASAGGLFNLAGDFNVDNSIVAVQLNGSDLGGITANDFFSVDTINTNVTTLAGTNTLTFVVSNPHATDPTNASGLAANLALTAVPEPSSTALLGLGALGLLVRRKR